MWAQRALHALHGIASHAVNFEFARPAAAPIASRQLAQAWQAFQAAVTRGSSSSGDGPTSAAGVPAVAAAAAASSAAPVASATAANGVAHGVAGISQHGQAADEPEDEEVCIIRKDNPLILSCRWFSCCLVYATVPDYVFSLLPGACNHQQVLMLCWQLELSHARVITLCSVPCCWLVYGWRASSHTIAFAGDCVSATAWAG